MTAIAAITVNDSVPVARTLAVVGTTGSIAQYADKSSGIPIGYTQVTHEVRLAKSGTGAHSVILSTVMPTVSTVSGVNTRARVSSVQTRFNFAQDSTLIERKDLFAIHTNCLANATMKSSVENIEPFY